MNPSSPQLAELHDLVDRLLGGSLDAAACQRLNHLLCASEAARQIYLDNLAIHAALAFRSSLHSSASDWTAEPLLPAEPQLGTSWVFSATSLPEEWAGEASPWGAASLGAGSSAAANAPRGLSPAVAPRAAGAWFNRPLTWSVLAVGVLFAAYFVAVSWNMRSQPAVRPLGAPVATLRSASGVRWAATERATAPQQGGPLHRGESYRIDAGLVELQLNQGVTLRIEGPAEWRIEGTNNATLARGKLLASVPRKAIGFTLSTPEALIVDLGTEFGVEVVSDGPSDVYVIKGEIEVQPADSDAVVPQKLRAGQAVQLTRTHAVVEDRPAVPDKFRRLVAASPSASGTAVDTLAPSAALTSDLVAYYPFDGDTRDQAARCAVHGGTHADDLTIAGSSEFLVGKLGQGLRLTGGFASAPFSADLQLPPDFTVELWIVAERLTESYQRLVLNWRDAPSPLRVWHLSLFRQGAEFAVGQADGQLIRAQGGTVRIERWEHLAAVVNDAQLRVYLNARLVAQQPCDGTLQANGTEGLGVGDNAGGQLPGARFRGAIDELAIWRRALTADQIQARMRDGQRGIPLLRARGSTNPATALP